ncbi:MAG: GTP 3',8-cyclase MoaA [Clostridiaceae bacterium]|nr:GTP 3',8-cyclase MoaA [Eubacteriales bacterium]
MNDSFGRDITYLRLSITERCTLRCAYCRASEGVCPKQEELSAHELIRIVRVMAGMGVSKVRLTGGEPMLRKDLDEIVGGIAQLEGISELVMTTNAQHLAGRAHRLRELGLSRLNISLDSLNEERYHSLTGGGELKRVLSGIDEALGAGLTPLKLNVVLIRGVNDDEIDAFLSLAKDRPLDVRFIELMPIGNRFKANARIPTDEILAAHPNLKPLPPREKGQPAREYAAEGFLGRVGFISPLSHKFCADCNRVRVMSDGMLRPCLGSNAEVSLKEALGEKDDAALEAAIKGAIRCKPKEHDMCGPFVSQKNMSKIGG